MSMPMAHQMTSLPHEVFLKCQPENPRLVSLSLLNRVSDFPGLANLQNDAEGEPAVYMKSLWVV